MPRQAHGRSVQSNTRAARPRKQKRSNALHALEVAEKQNPESVRIRQHRLGEVENDDEAPETRADVGDRSSKRRKINDTRNSRDGTDLVDRDEDLASGSDDEGGRWHEGIEGSDEDSDIDSDEAFGASDEERFADFTFRGGAATTKRKSVRTKPSRSRNVDLDEKQGWQDASQFNANKDEDMTSERSEYEEEDEEDDLGDDAVDLATALDMNLEEERKEAERLARKANKSQKNIRPSNQDLQDEWSDASDTGESSNFSMSEDDAEGDHAGLQSFVTKLEASNNEEVNKPRRQRSTQAISDRPSTFGLASAKISAADLAQYITDPVQRQALKMVQTNEKSVTTASRGGIPGKLSVPLAKRQQDKLDRAAAYEKSKETLNRWIDTVKHSRRSEHLSFPLIDAGSMGAKSTRQLPQTNHTAPRTELETTIQDILEESGIARTNHGDLEQQEVAYEELEEKKIPLEEVRERRAQLRLARELMFREEIRAKRIKKIKSKAYRRVHRKERDKIEAQQREQLAAAGLLNSDEEREKNDRRRAEERMGARHKESKWAKGVKQAGRTAWDDDARVGVSELARRDEELRRRIEGKSGINSDLSASDSDSDLDGEDSDTEQDRLKDKLSNLQETNGKMSKLGSMAFMLRAEAARKAQNDEEIQELKDVINGDMKQNDESEDDTFGSAGRQRFGATSSGSKVPLAAKPKRDDFEAFLSEDETYDHEATEITAPSAATSQNSRSAQQSLPKQGDKKGRSARRQTEANESGTLTVQSQAAKMLQAHGDSLSKERSGAFDDDDYTSPSDTDDEAQTPPNTDDNKAALAASIFAGPDDAVREFEREKALVVEEEGDQVVDNTLPGWGSWTGAGISKREQKKGKGRFLTTIPGVAPEKRQDAKLDKVIINEKRNKKNGKYLATELPHPFETRQQYERSLRLPMGPEWSTVNHFQEAIKPRILLKQGSVIAPIKKPIL